MVHDIRNPKIPKKTFLQILDIICAAKFSCCACDDLNRTATLSCIWGANMHIYCAWATATSVNFAQREILSVERTFEVLHTVRVGFFFVWSRRPVSLTNHKRVLLAFCSWWGELNNWKINIHSPLVPLSAQLKKTIKTRCKQTLPHKPEGISGWRVFIPEHFWLRFRQTRGCKRRQPR